MDDATRARYFASLTAGAAVSHDGTTLTAALLADLLTAMRDPTTGKARLGEASFIETEFVGLAQFDGAHFEGEAWFERATFESAAFNGAHFAEQAQFSMTGFACDSSFTETEFARRVNFSRSAFARGADFSDARFIGQAWFDSVQFEKSTRFERARFDLSAWFTESRFAGNAWFDGVQFHGETSFPAVQFLGDAWFDHSRFGPRTYFSEAVFEGNARFYGVIFDGPVSFDRADFNSVSHVGPIVCDSLVDLSLASFTLPVIIEIAARHLICVRTNWDATATLRLRYARVDLTDAVLTSPVAVNSHPASFATDGPRQNEGALTDTPKTIRVTSVSGVDAAHLVLTDGDLSECRFAGAFHLDQIRLEGSTTFAPVPTGVHRRRHPWPDRWSQRRTLAEEHHWRAKQAAQPAPAPGQRPDPSRWRPGPHHTEQTGSADPDDIAAVYRQLRKAFEDGKNEPGAADFYYGEMEMRRHDHSSTPRSERGLLHAYWLLSGYGLRASRAFTWLLLAMLTTILLLMGFGLPQHSPAQEATGTVPAGGGRATFTIDKDDPQNPSGNRFTGERFDKALTATLNSVIFRSSGEDLTTTGTYIEMTSRLLEPALLALAVLAIRGRVKR